MYNIRNIYLDNVGYRDAWFRNLNIPLYEYNSGKVSNTVLSLTNGGGKTTILSLIFSCIVPEQRNFIQHLQKSAHNFRDYFDSTPGLIVLELEKLANKESNLFDEKFVIGQFVYINQSDGEPVRIFFSFNPDSFSIEEIPTFSGGQIKTKNDLKSWITDSQSRYSNFFWTSKQQDWKDWLDKNGVDTWLAEKQVGFCRSEGGIDKFMSFNSERDFLKEFFYMSLSTEDSEDVRSVLSLSLNKLKKRPRFEAQSELLSKLKELQENFSKDASFYDKALNEHNKALKESGLLYHSFKQDISNKDDEIVENEAVLNRINENIRKSDNDLKDIINRISCLNYHILSERLKEKENDSKEIELKKESLTEEEKNCKASVIYKKTEILKKEIDELRKSVTTNSNLNEARIKSDESCVRLKIRLNKIKDELKQQISDLLKEIEKAKKESHVLQSNLSDINNRVKEADEKKAVIHSFNSLKSKALEKLINQGILKDEDPENKIKELKGLKKEIRGICEKQKVEIEELNFSIEKINSELKNSEKSILSYENKNSNLLYKINESDRLKKEICTNQFFNQIYGTDDFDPDNLDVYSALNSYIERKKDLSNRLLIEKEDNSRLLDQISSIKSSITDRNTINVLSYLKEKGITSAELYTEFLSDHYKEDKLSLIRHIEKNPGRYSGICCDERDFESLQQIVIERVFEKPVVVSPAEIKDEDNPFITIFGAESISLSEEDLFKEKTRFRKKIEDIEQKLELINSDLNSLYQLKVKIDKYNDEFGSAKIKKYRNEYDSIHSKRIDLINSNSLLIEKRKTDETSFTDISKSLSLNEKNLEKISYDIKLLESFISDYREDSVKNDKMLDGILKNESELEEKINSIKEEIDKISNSIDLKKSAISQNERETDLIESEILILESSDSIKLDDIKHLSDQEDVSTDLLRSQYKLNNKILKNIESDNNLDNFNQIIDTKNEQIRSLENEFKRFRNTDSQRVIELSEFDENLIFKKEEETRLKLDKISELKATNDFEIKDLKKQIKEFKKVTNFNQFSDEYESLSIDNLEKVFERMLNDKKILYITFEEIKRESEKLYKKIELLKKVKRETSLLQKNIRIEDINIEINEITDLPDDMNLREKSVDETNERYSQTLLELNKKRAISEDSFNKLVEFARTEKFISIEQNLSSEILRGNFEDSASQIDLQLTKTIERIESVNAIIDESQKDLDLCVDKLMNHITMAFSRLKRAVKISSLPESLDKFGGLKVLKLGTDINSIPQSARKQALEIFVKSLTVKEYLPSVGSINGDELTADAVCSIVKSRNASGLIGIKIIKLSRNVTYTPVEKVTGSGGESMTAALLLYLVMAQLRAESKGGSKDSAGGFLLMDNPFAKATKPEFVKAQVELANLLGFQLIYATGIKDLNAIGQFAHIVQLRPSSVNLSDDKINVDKVMIESSEITTLH